MSVRIEQAAEEAHRLVETGEVTAAHEMLREALATVEPDPARATPELAHAAALYARVLVALDERALARRWAAYAHTASQRLFGADDERTLQTASVLAGVLYRAGAYSRSAHLYRELVDQLSALDGPRSARVLAARADLATVLHARGECANARTLLAKTWTAYRYLFGESDPVGIRMLARLGAMERDCGLPGQARERFEQAEALCRRYLPPDHRLAEQVATVALAPASPDHVCTAPGGVAEPDESAEWPPEAGPPASAPAKAPGTALVRSPRHLRRPPPRRYRRRLALAGFATMAVAIVSVLTIATGALIAQARSGTADDASSADRPPTQPAAAPPPSPSPPASSPSVAPSPPATPPPTGPPTGVRLADARTSITLSWTYPRGAKAPVVLTAGRPGQPRTAFQTLPAGTSRYTVYGLGESVDWCFGVGVAYSRSAVATARPVCTARG